MKDVFPDHVGLANGVADAAPDAGQAGLPVLAGVITAVAAWQYGLGFTVRLFALLAFGLFLTLPARTSPASRGELTSLADLRSFGVVFRRPPLLYGAIVMVVFTCVWMILQTFYPTYLIKQKALSQSTAGLLYRFYFGLGVAIKPAAGAMYHACGARRSLTAVIALTTTGLVLVTFLKDVLALAVVTVGLSTVLAYNRSSSCT